MSGTVSAGTSETEATTAASSPRPYWLLGQESALVSQSEPTVRLDLCFAVSVLFGRQAWWCYRTQVTSPGLSGAGIGRRQS